MQQLLNASLCALPRNSERLLAVGSLYMCDNNNAHQNKFVIFDLYFVLKNFVVALVLERPIRCASTAEVLY